MNWFQLNKRIIQVFNSCKYEEFEQLLSTILSCDDYEKYFTSKWYIWNIIRPRDFYKMCAMYIQKKTDKDTIYMTQIEKLIKVVLKTAKNDQIKKTFVWNVTKNVPLIMWEMIPYMSQEKIINMMTKKKYVITDEYTQPFFVAIEVIRNGIETDMEEERD